MTAREGSLTVYRQLEQGSDEWLEARLGMVTASTVGRLITSAAPSPTTVTCPDCGADVGEPCRSKAKRADVQHIKTWHPQRVALANYEPHVLGLAETDTARNLIDTLAAERITGRVHEVRVTNDMIRGTFEEPFARDAYTEHHAPVAEVGFMVRTIGGARLGYSPDGLVGTDGLIEIKSRQPQVHLRHVLAGVTPTEHMAQIQCGLLVSGRAWCDYVSYSGGMALWTNRTHADPTWHAIITEAVAHAEQRITALTERYTEATAGLPMTDPTPDFSLEPVI